MNSTMSRGAMPDPYLRQRLQLYDRSTRDSRGGANAGDWLAASEMPESSFHKARGSLVGRHLVARKGEGRGVMYAVTLEGD